LREQIIDRNKYQNIIGESKPVLNTLKLIQKVENSSLITLITGESGTGKEVVAHTIHYNSPRKRKPFVAVNVAAIPVDLIESELFGHEKGAFTGAANKRIGKFEEAHEGTIFLDEIGEMAIDLQTKLLRVLQDSKITRLGGNKEITLDIRIIAATNKNLMDRVKEGKFREDLYYRLQGFLIHLPPLRERGNDIVILAKHFSEQFCKSNRMATKLFSPHAIEGLLNHNWPGNVRELRSMVERAVLLSESQKIEQEDLIFAHAYQ
jgi:transcriptional regulator with GAF, ATPase, and Fis domain